MLVLLFLACRPAEEPPIVIAEVLTSNASGIQDERGKRSDWIELWNRESGSTDLEGYRLIYDGQTKALPNHTLLPDERFVVFATKDTLGFTLRKRGELVLSSPSGGRSRLLLPAQRSDTSYGVDEVGDVGYFVVPSPGAPPSERVKSGHLARPYAIPGRGVYTSTVHVELRSKADQIRYTLDGSDPLDGQVYVGRILLPACGAVVLRAVALAPGRIASEIATHTYVFPHHAHRQESIPPGLPERWGSGQFVTGADYAMDRRIDGVGAALAELPSVSIVLDPKDLFDPYHGIYANPSRKGSKWERRGSMELIDGSGGFQIDAGLRAQGSSAVQAWRVKKVSLRVRFDRRFGTPRLEHDLFGDGLGWWKSLILEAQNNNTWAHPKEIERARAQYVRDAYVADLMREVGQLAPRWRYVHLYLNGLYWGVYAVTERPDASFAALHLGGRPRDYEVVRQDAVAVDGSAADFLEVIGLAEKGDLDAVAQRLDVPAFIDYFLVNLYVGNTDWPDRNWYAIRKRGGPWRFVTWDAEQVLGDPNVRRFSERGGADRRSEDFDSWGTVGPAKLYLALENHPSFRAAFEKRARELLEPTGVLGHRARALYEARSLSLEKALVAESARWGDAQREEPYRVGVEWRRERERLLGQWFPRRTAVVVEQLRRRGLW